MKTIHKAAAAAGVSILGVCTWAGTRAEEGSTSTAGASISSVTSASPSTLQAWNDPRQAVASAAAAAAAPSASDEEGFRPSEFAGVSVRERPSSTSSAADNTGPSGWIAVKPGEPLTTKVPGQAGMRRATTGWRLKQTRLGGKKLISPSLMHRSEVTRVQRPQGKAQNANR